MKAAMLNLATLASNNTEQKPDKKVPSRFADIEQPRLRLEKRLGDAWNNRNLKLPNCSNGSRGLQQTGFGRSRFRIVPRLSETS